MTTLAKMIETRWTGTLEEFAAAARCSLGTAWNWRKGESSPQVRHRKRLAEILEVSAQELELAILETQRARAGRSDVAMLEDAAEFLAGSRNRYVMSLVDEIRARLAAGVEGARQ